MTALAGQSQPLGRETRERDAGMASPGEVELQDKPTLQDNDLSTHLAPTQLAAERVISATHLGCVESLNHDSDPPPRADMGSSAEQQLETDQACHSHAVSVFLSGNARIPFVGLGCRAASSCGLICRERDMHLPVKRGFRS